jgi:hypothetical protein
MDPETDRRKWQRHAADPQARCDLLVGRAENCRPVGVKSVSRGGVELLVDIPIPPGEVLWGQFQKPAGRLLWVREMRAVHCFPLADGSYILGAAFTRELSDDQVAALK